MANPPERYRVPGGRLVTDDPMGFAFGRDEPAIGPSEMYFLEMAKKLFAAPGGHSVGGPLEDDPGFVAITQIQGGHKYAKGNVIVPSIIDGDTLEAMEQLETDIVERLSGTLDRMIAQADSMGQQLEHLLSSFRDTAPKEGTRS